MAISIDTTIPAMIKFQLPGCGTGLIVQKTREIAEDFFRRSTAYRTDLDAFDTVADQAEYSLTPPDDCIIGAVYKVTIDDAEVHPSRYLFSSDDVFSFSTAPTESGKSVVVSVVVYPTADTTTYPDDIIGRFKRAIADGVLSSLKGDPVSARTPVKWYEPNGALMYSRRYESAIFKAHDEMITNRKSDTVRVDIPYFA